jgi:hypothetical protein
VENGFFISPSRVNVSSAPASLHTEKAFFDDHKLFSDLKFNGCGSALSSFTLLLFLHLIPLHNFIRFRRGKIT